MKYFDYWPLLFVSAEKTSIEIFLRKYELSYVLTQNLLYLQVSAFLSLKAGTLFLVLSSSTALLCCGTTASGIMVSNQVANKWTVMSFQVMNKIQLCISLRALCQNSGSMDDESFI